jgi:hypothetical protein
VFIFGFGRSLLRNNYDLYLIRLLGKKIISNLAHGSEARPAFLSGNYQSIEGLKFSNHQINLYNSINKRTVKKHFKYANIVIGAPYSTSHFAVSKFINFFALGIPMQLSQLPIINVCREVKLNTSSRPVRILHAPSHPAAKGSSLIIQSIENLRQKGYLIDFILIHGRSFTEVLDEIKMCDFVVDQVYSDTPLAGFATESAWFKKPSIVGGFGFEKLKCFVPEGMWPPSKTCHPDQIEQAIEELIVDVEQRELLGQEAQKFVCDKWNSIQVSKRYLQLIEGDFPDDWWLEPKDVTYFEGVGQNLSRTKEIIRELVEVYGVDTLQLSHRPDLELAFLEFADMQQNISSHNA